MSKLPTAAIVIVTSCEKPRALTGGEEFFLTQLQYRKSRVPEGQAGDWTVQRFVMPDRGPDVADTDPRPAWVRAKPGVYTRLRLRSVDFMTDLYEEWWSQRVAMEEAVRRGGHVLVTGLGLGMVAETILRSGRASVTSVTVVEASAQVVQLVGPHLEASYPRRLDIVQADAFTWTPPAGACYSVVWHDIWPSPFDPQAVAESHELMARYARFADWQGSWALEYRSLAGLDD